MGARSAGVSEDDRAGTLPQHMYALRWISPGSLGLLCGGLLHVAALAGSPSDSKVVQVYADHGLPDILRHRGEHLRILVVRHSLHNSPRALLRIGGLEDATAHEDAVDAELHAERSVR